MINYPVCVDLTWRHSDLLIGEFCRLRGAVWSSCHCLRRGHVIWSKNVTSHLSERGTIMWLYPLLSSDWWTAARSNYEWFNNKTFMRWKQTRSVSGVLSLFFPDRPQNKKNPEVCFYSAVTKKSVRRHRDRRLQLPSPKRSASKTITQDFLCKMGKTLWDGLSLNFYILMRRRCSEIRLNYSWRPFYFSVCS